MTLSPQHMTLGQIAPRLLWGWGGRTEEDGETCERKRAISGAALMVLVAQSGVCVATLINRWSNKEHGRQTVLAFDQVH